MRLLLINPPYQGATGRLGAQLPLGLLSIGGPLADAGHEVRLLDGEARRLGIEEIASEAKAWNPAAILTGHSGSTPAHPTIMRMTRALKAALPDAIIVYGGVFPTYHATDILCEEPQIDAIVRGEGEETAVRLAAALEGGRPLSEVPGIAYRGGAAPVLTPPAAPIRDLDDTRVGWELIEDWDLYQCWGLGRSVIVQLSRGCPHLCAYCGQRGFWTRQRYRTPEKLAAEIAWLHRAHGVRFVDLADENPTTSPKSFRRFLEALIAHDLDIRLFATLRAGDIVRDADILPLYKRAGFECILMGMETTDTATMARIRKGSTVAMDLQAIRLLRKNGIMSMMGHVVGFAEERDRDYWNALRQILLYDPDLINAMYVTPHRWTPFYAESAGRGVIEPDPGKWDYRHQVLSTRVPPWRVFLWVKLMELCVALRPRALRRLLSHPDPSIRRALRWCFSRSGLVWLDEIVAFFFRDRRLSRPLPLTEVRGLPEPHREYALARGRDAQKKEVPQTAQNAARAAPQSGSAHRQSGPLETLGPP